MNVLEDCIIFFIWAVGVLFNFHYKQKQRFSVRALLRMPPSSPSMVEFSLDIQK